MVNINNNLNPNIYMKGLREKPEGRAKGEEPEPKEKPETKPAAPEQAAVTAKADDVLANYAKALMFTEPTSGVNSPKPVHGEDGPRDIPPEIQTLIDQWNQEHDTMTREAKISLLTQIIEAFTNIGDTYHENIWRVRRYTTAFNHTSENLEILNNFHNGGGLFNVYYFGTGPYPGMDGDIAAYSDFYERYNNHQLNEEEEMVYLENRMASYSTNTLVRIYWYTTPGRPTEFYEEQKDLAKRLANDLYGVTQRICAKMPDANWQAKFAEYNTKYQEFQAAIEDAVTNSAESYAVQMHVDELTGLIDELRDLGFPYCDELLIAIQGYVVYAAHDDIYVLPYPEG